MSRTRPSRTPAPLAPAKTAARPATGPAKAAARYAAAAPARVSARPGADAAKPRSVATAAKPAARSVTATPAKPATRAAVTSAKAAARSAAATPVKVAARSSVAAPKAAPRPAVAAAKAMLRPAAGKNGNAHASMSREDIADHLAAFRKRGGRIEVLGTTPLRTTAPAAFRSRTAVKRQAQARASEKSGG